MTDNTQTLSQRLRDANAEQLKIRTILLETNLIVVGSSYDRQIKALANKLLKAATLLEAN